ncbi:TetR/AcrR family transcriptional regulator [Streptococcus equinus]|uniref:Transcriptional regulator, TetR family n=1 Tax=Streptococcus equinus ATCC 9812 TaxID=525379 RepID=E8JNN4_STREI|nr:TetR/AcrR family transcriptional regulator [Streptococcus equinus]EFW89233.1 transcriptional regulator, TetR family [Streptococcus equinus ATCC 9812]SUN57029.1 transcriptional regulator [Streptococcus equinus]
MKVVDSMVCEKCGKLQQIKDTKNRLFLALICLMRNEKYENITIKDILEYAEVSRRIFYRHFKNKDNLLNYYFKKIINEYLAERRIFAQSENFEKMSTSSFDFWYRECEVLSIIIKHQKSELLFHQMKKYSKEIYDSVTLPWFAYDGDVTKINYAMSFIIGGYYSVLCNWLVKDEPEDPSVIALEVKKMVIKLTKFFDLDVEQNLQDSSKIKKAL